MRKVYSDSKIKSSIKELKKYSVRREIGKTAKNIAENMKNISPETSYLEIIESADQIYNDKINLFEIGFDQIVFPLKASINIVLEDDVNINLSA